MFTNLIESDSHRQEFKRRSSFFLATVAAYAVILFAAGIVSVYAYDARLENQNTDILISWVPPVTRVVEQIGPQPTRRTPATNTNRTSRQPTRPILYESASNPTKPPGTVSSAPNPIPPAPPNAIIRPYVSDPPIVPTTSGNCATCTGNSAGPVVRETTTPPEPAPVKPQTQKLPYTVLVSKAISLPQPPYPPIAKQIGVQGAVNVQILVDEEGKVISAQAVTGHPTLLHAAKEAALRARFTPTVLNGQPVKVQGVITYNFVLR